MKADSARGFTIIEVVLYLTITGAVFAALMIGVNTSVTQQRYIDSVRSYKALVQNQFAEVVSPRNEDVDNKICSTRADGTIDDGDRSTSPRGTSECVILGRVIQVTDEGRVIKTSSVTGHYPGDSVEGNESDILKSYKPKVAEFDQQETEIDWGSSLHDRLRMSASGSASNAVIVILRSPVSGLIRIFTSLNSINSNDLEQIITAINFSKVETCVDGDSGLLPKQLVSIDPSIGSADAITIINTDDSRTEDCQR